MPGLADAFEFRLPAGWEVVEGRRADDRHARRRTRAATISTVPTRN